MTDIRADAADNDDRLPWLEAVDEEDESDGPSVLKLIVAVLIGLAAIGGIVGGIFWLMNRDATPAGGDGELIAAPEGDYKVKPADPGGMNVAGAGDTVYAASEGAEPKGTLAQPRSQAPAARPSAPPQQSQRPPAQPQPPAAPSATIQLGAFSSQAGATRAWTALSGRFRYLAPLTHSLIPVQSDGRTLYRLRATGPDAAGICRRLQIAGEDCSVVS
jgi:hypothetical protein